MRPCRGWRAVADWSLIDGGTPAVDVAERAALSTDARVAAWPPHLLAQVLATINSERADEVVVSEEVAQRADGFSYEDMGPVTRKGVTADVARLLARYMRAPAAEPPVVAE